MITPHNYHDSLKIIIEETLAFLCVFLHNKTAFLNSCKVILTRIAD